MAVKSLHCQNCGANMELSDDMDILCCPYCGANALIDEDKDVAIGRLFASANVKSDRIRAKAYTDAVSKQEETKIELERMAFEKEKWKLRNDIIAICVWVLAIILLLVWALH